MCICKFGARGRGQLARWCKERDTAERVRGRRSTQESICRTVRSRVTSSPFIHFCCSHFSQTFCMSSAINIAWGKRDAHGWACPCGERLSILDAPDTEPYELQCKGKKHRASIAPAAKGHQILMMRFFSLSSQGPQPLQLNLSTASQPSNDPNSPHSGASIEPLVKLPVSCHVPTKCMGVLPLGVSSALVLRGCYPLMCHAHEKVH